MSATLDTGVVFLHSRDMDRATFWLHVDMLRSRACAVDVYLASLDAEDHEGFLLAWLDLALLTMSFGRAPALHLAKELVLQGRRALCAALGADHGSEGAVRSVAA